jgi:hypothetical protein
MFLRVSLCLAIGGFVVAVVANLGLYINGDFLPEEVRGPHPLAGAVGEISLQVGIFVIPCAVVLSFFGLPLSFFRAPVVANFLAALAGLLVSIVAGSIDIDGLTRVRANPARAHASMEGRRLADVLGGVVLLFGTQPAQNPAGDRPLLTADGYGGIGAVVLFADLHLEFVKADNFGGLQWEP